MKILLGEGLITSEGAFHMRQRRIAAPAFHRQRIAAYADVMTERAALRRASWHAGQTIDVGAEMMQLALEIVARTLFNTEVTSDVLQINHEVNVIMDLYNYLISLPLAEAYLYAPLPGLTRFRRARSRLNAVVHRIIADHRSRARAGAADNGDLLSMLMASRDEEGGGVMTDDQLRDEIITIFLAGYETVANALTWTWLLLAQNPEAAQRFYDEVARVLDGRVQHSDDLPQLRYTEMVFAESMRLYPPAWAMGRQSTAPIELGRYRFPPRTYFFLQPYVTQRDPILPRPAALRSGTLHPGGESRASALRLLPFGGGARQCIGESFAWMEGVLILATIAQQWRLSLLPDQQIDVQPKITLRPKYPIHMRVEG